ncbi:MAG: hypothetical protein WB586_07675 [Chthoniobacterales bacterium]
MKDHRRRRLQVFYVKILVTLAYRVGCETVLDQVMAQDLGEVGVLAQLRGPELQVLTVPVGAGAG